MICALHMPIKNLARNIQGNNFFLITACIPKEALS